MAAKLKKGDRVVVIAGKDKGQKGEITQVMPKEGRAIVSGVNQVVRHRKQSAGQEGGRVTQSAPIQLSNLMLVDPKSGEPTRVGFKLREDGTKVRVAKKSGEEIEERKS
ncbi:MAG: 50S ribosomal protein L24 [Neomegalonema sp.]|nr:50S ribosomal protein L24 [Neomegalonema sp.]